MCYTRQHVPMATKGDCPPWEWGDPTWPHPLTRAPPAGAGWQSQNATGSQAGPFRSEVPGGQGVQWSACFLTKGAAAARLQGMAATQKKMGRVQPNLRLSKRSGRFGPYAHSPNPFYG